MRKPASRGRRRGFRGSRDRDSRGSGDEKRGPLTPFEIEVQKIAKKVPLLTKDEFIRSRARFLAELSIAHHMTIEEAVQELQWCRTDRRKGG